MTPWRTALLGGLLYSLPLGLWLLFGLEVGSATIELSAFHRVLLWSQALSLVLLLPALAVGANPGRTLAASLLLIAVPWPLLSVVFLTHTASLAGLLAGQSTLIAWGLALNGIHRLLDRAPSYAWRQSAPGMLQAAAFLTLLVGLAPALREMGL